MDGLLSDDGKYKFIERLGTYGFLGRIYEMKTGYPDCYISLYETSFYVHSKHFSINRELMEFMWKIREKHPAPKWVVGDNDCNVKFDKPKN